VKPLQSTYTGTGNFTGNAFITQFNAAGSELEFSTYLGGSGTPQASCPAPQLGVVCELSGDVARAIAADAAGNIYTAGSTGSTDFPLFTPLQDTNRAAAALGTNAFVSKILLSPASGANPGSSGGAGAAGWSLLGVLGLVLVARRRRVAALARNTREIHRETCVHEQKMAAGSHEQRRA
jgi:hypothetical protein